MALNWVCNNNNSDSKTEDNSKYIQIKSIFKKDIFFSEGINIFEF